MTIRNPVSFPYNIWYDGQQVDQQDLTLEQNRNLGTDASIIQNHFGTGVLPHSYVQTVLFDTDNLFPDQASLIQTNSFDGTGLLPTTQPSDTILGNQLEVQLLDDSVVLNGPTTVGGRLCTKVLIIGLDFQSNPQYERLAFYRKEKQVTKKHYTEILSIFFNDFYGNNNCSRQLGGRVIIREAASFEISRDPIMISQDVQPNLFFRDFKISNTTVNGGSAITLYQAIQAGIGLEYSVDALSINTTVSREIELDVGDVTTRLAEKFVASTNNIQKISMLLGVRKNTSAATDNQFDWSGDLIVSVYALQTSVSSPSDIVPGLAIQFDPNPVPINQFSLTQSSLESQGYVLSDVLQPVDFVYNSSILGNTTNPVIIPGKYYAISIGRAGDTSNGTLFTGIGGSQDPSSSYLSIFTGSWTDSPNEAMWFQVWTDSAKVSDGQGYDTGNGMQINKTTTNELGAVVDYCYGQNPLANSGQNTLNTAILEAVVTPITEQSDTRTGSPVDTQQEYEPSLSFVTNTTLATLRQTSEPLVLGCCLDSNAKGNVSITGVQTYPGLAKGDTFTIINPNADILSQQLIGSKLIPSNTCNAISYMISSVYVCTDGYGDVNGDGVIDQDDLLRCTQLLGQSLSSSITQANIVAGTMSTLEILRADVDGDGIITANDASLIANYVARTINAFPVGSSFQHAEITVQNATGRTDGYYDCDGYIRLDGYLGLDIIDPSGLDPTQLSYYGYYSVPSIDGDDPGIWNAVPFVPATYVIQPIPFWQDYLLQFSSEARLVPAVFSFSEDMTLYSDPAPGGNCATQTVTVCSDTANFDGVCNPGRNDMFVPNNLVIGKGQIINPDGSFFSQDIEIYPITLEVPAQYIFTQGIINVFEKLVKDNGNGFTSAGFPAARFADCSTVQASALENNQVRFDVAIQSMYPNLDGYDGYGFGIVVDDLIGINMDQSTGILTLSTQDQDYEAVYAELRTKITITVYLKRAGFNNAPLTVSANQLVGLFVSGVAPVA